MSLALLLFAAPAFADAPAYAPGAPTDAAAFAFQQHPGAQVPLDLPLTGDNGAPTTLRALAAGRPILLVMNYFHCPNLCGTVRDDVFQALDRSSVGPNDVLLAAVSIDPAENPGDARTARASEQPPPGAAFLTGDARPIEAAVGFPSRWIEADKQFLHPAGVVALTPRGAVSSYLLGVGYQPADIEQAVRLAAHGDVAAAANPILLLCFHYDPATGRYSLAITRVLQLAAVITALSLGGTLVLAHRRGAA